MHNAVKFDERFDANKTYLRATMRASEKELADIICEVRSLYPTYRIDAELFDHGIQVGLRISRGGNRWESRYVSRDFSRNDILEAITLFEWKHGKREADDGDFARFLGVR